MLKIKEVVVSKVNAIEVMEDNSMYVIKHLEMFDHCIVRQAKDCTLSDVLSEDNKVIQITKVES